MFKNKINYVLIGLMLIVLIFFVGYKTKAIAENPYAQVTLTKV